MLEPGPSERESDFSDLEIKTERVLAEDVAAKRKTPAAPEAPVIVPEPVTVTASMTRDQLPGNAMVRVHQPIPGTTTATRTVPVVVHNLQSKMPTPIPMPMPLPAAEGPILRASLGYEQSPVIQKVMVPGPLSKKTDQQVSPVQLPTPPMKRISSRAVKVIRDIYKEAKEAEAASNTSGKRQSKGNTAEKDVNNWDCPVCKQKLEESVRLRDHLKTHLSDEVS